MHEIHPKLLWVGHALDVREPRAVIDAGITAIIDLAYEEAVAQIPRSLTYCRFPLHDGGGNPPEQLVQVLRSATGFLRSGTPTMIACSAGLSRSPTVAAFALAHHLSQTPEEVLTRIADVKALEWNSELWSDMAAAAARFRSECRSGMNT